MPTKGHASKMQGIKANFVFNVLGTLASLVVAFVTVPIYVSHIGAARYGVVSIVWLLLGYFGFLDLGLSRASVNALSKLKSSSQEERSKVLITTFSLNLALGTLGGLIIYFAGGFLFEHLVDVPESLKPEIVDVFPWIAALLPLAMISGVAIGVLESQDRFLAANVLQVAGTTFGQVLPVLCAVFISPSLSTVIPAAALARGLSVALTLAFVLYDERPFYLRSFDRKRARELLGYGGWASVSAILGPLLTSLDQLVISSVLRVTAVTYYAVPMSLITRSQILATAMTRTLFPQWSRTSPDEANRLAEKALVSLAYGYGLICAPAIILVTPFIAWWMGKDFALIAGPVAELLLVGAWINGLAYIPAVLLQGQNRPDIVAKFNALEIIPFIGVLWLLATHFGLIGSAVAWVLRASVDAALLFAVARFWANRFPVLLPPIGLILTAFLFVQIANPTLVQGLAFATLLAGAGAISGLIFDVYARSFIFSLFDTTRLRILGK